MANEFLAEYWDRKALDLVDEARKTNDFVSARHELIARAGVAIRQAFVLRKQDGWKQSLISYRDVELRRGEFAHHAAWLETQAGFLEVAEDFTTAESIYYWRGQDLKSVNK